MPSKTAAAVAAPGANASISTDLPSRKKLVSRIAERFGVDDTKLLATLKATAFHQGKPKEGKPLVEVTDEQMMALLVVADQYKLNPFTKEIYAFPSDKGIVPIVSVDGWTRIINERQELASIEFEYSPDDSEDPWISCTIARHDRAKPITVREYGKECYRDTIPWNSHPRRMLRHKVLIQCARIAFGFAGIYDPDEAERIREARTVEGQVVSHKAGTAAPKAIEAPAAAAAEPATAGAIGADVVAMLRKRLEDFSLAESELLAVFEIGKLEDLPFDCINPAYDWISKAARAV